MSSTTPPPTDYSTLASVGFGMAVFSMTSQAVNSYYAVLSSRYDARSRASELEFRADLSDINRRGLEADARQELIAGQHEIGRVTLQYAQLKGQQQVQQAAGGIVAGVGSAGEVTASTEYAKQADVITLGTNARRRAAAIRRGATSEEIAARSARVSAGNLRSGARAANPWMAGLSGFISGAAPIAGAWAEREERRGYYRSRAGA